MTGLRLTEASKDFSFETAQSFDEHLIDSTTIHEVKPKAIQRITSLGVNVLAHRTGLFWLDRIAKVSVLPVSCSSNVNVIGVLFVDVYDKGGFDGFGVGGKEIELHGVSLMGWDEFWGCFFFGWKFLVGR